MMTNADLTALLKERCPDAVRAAHSWRGDQTARINRESLVKVARTLKEDPAFQMDFLMDVTAVDYLTFGQRPPRAFFPSSGVDVAPAPEIPADTPWPGGPEKERFVVVYHFYSSSLRHRIRLHVPVEEKAAELDSLTSLWPAANWLEREVWDMYGIRFKGHPNLKRILMYEEFIGHPLRKDYPVNQRQPLAGPGAVKRSATPSAPAAHSKGSGDLETREMLLNVGPAHPAMHGIIRLVLKLQGERVKEVDVEIGYLHRGFEKMAEVVDYNGVMPYTDRLNYVSPLINNMGYSMAVEKLLGLNVPERCHYIRVIMSEISRLSDHLTCVGASAMELGAFSVFLYLIKAREFLWELVEMVTGARLTISYCRVGGVKGDLPEDFEDRCQKALEETKKVLKEADALLTRNRIFVDRMSGTGVISAQEAIAYGITGPFLRASGTPYDVRKDCPYSVYDRFDFDVPVGAKGDNLDRYYVRMEEMRQSIRIIEAALKTIPPGPVLVDPETGRPMAAAEMVDSAKIGDIPVIARAVAVTDPTLGGSARPQHLGIAVEEKRVVLPPKEDTYGNIEGLMRHFKLVMQGHGVRPPKGESYFPVEGANGELGFYVVSDGSECAYRVRVRPPCFAIMSALPRLLTGDMLADVVPTFGSVNMIGGELDR
ncbi:MAG: NADH-quinone oxidoreductase subunit D [Elusimicrobia bacterium]|nr:NADH-quinone oxidoreductase subunit D [Elusimicrobiota bacterium]